MNTTNLKAYAPKARRDFIEAVTRRAAKFGITEDEIAQVASISANSDKAIGDLMQASPRCEILKSSKFSCIGFSSLTGEELQYRK